MTQDPGGPGRPLSYRDAGVDVEAGNALVDAIKPLAASTARPGADAGLGGFGGLFDLKAAGYGDPVLVAANDGVGTKLKMAFATGRHDTVGIDLVAMCVNDLVVQGAEPLFFLDYFATGKLEPSVAEAVVSGIAAGCRMAGCALIGGETAEMPGMYAEGEYDLAGFSVGAAERGTLLPSAGMREGDAVVGLASSGPHSNGYSLIRRIVAEQGIDWAAPAPFEPSRSLGDALLEPTRIYVRALLSALGEVPGIRAFAHITGGGFTENIPRVLPDHLAAHIDLGTWRAAAVFEWLARGGRISEAELLRTFNCGVGMVAVVAAEHADAFVRHLNGAGETAFIAGRLEAREAGAGIRYDRELEFA